MTKQEHIKIHKKLHKALDELIADWVDNQPKEKYKGITETTILELIEWSCEQTKNPTEKEK